MVEKRAVWVVAVPLVQLVGRGTIEVALLRKRVVLMEIALAGGVRCGIAVTMVEAAVIHMVGRGGV